MSIPTNELDPERDLLLERVIDVPLEDVWAAWTQPEQLRQWFAPVPFMTTQCEIDLRPGGVFRTVIRSPEGDEHSTVGCYLHVDPPHTLVWTTTLGPGFRPLDEPTLPFTAVIGLAAVPEGTRYSATVMHSNGAGATEHQQRGFHAGWSTALDQLVEMIRHRMSRPT